MKEKKAKALLSPAKESPQVAKAREKLKKRIEWVEEKMTQQALEKKSLEIHRWIAKNASERVVLQAKNISLFDENQNTAKVSHRVSALAEKIQGEMHLVKKLSQMGQEPILDQKTQDK